LLLLFALLLWLLAWYVWLACDWWFCVDALLMCFAYVWLILIILLICWFDLLSVCLCADCVAVIALFAFVLACACFVLLGCDCDCCGFVVWWSACVWWYWRCLLLWVTLIACAGDWLIAWWWLCCLLDCWLVCFAALIDCVVIACDLMWFDWFDFAMMMMIDWWIADFSFFFFFYFGGGDYVMVIWIADCAWFELWCVWLLDLILGWWLILWYCDLIAWLDWFDLIWLIADWLCAFGICDVWIDEMWLIDDWLIWFMIVWWLLMWW